MRPSGEDLASVVKVAVTSTTTSTRLLLIMATVNVESAVLYECSAIYTTQMLFKEIESAIIIYCKHVSIITNCKHEQLLIIIQSF